MSDVTEEPRRELIAELNRDQSDRDELVRLHGKVWDTTELQAEFEARGFLAPFVCVRRRSDGVLGTLMYRHHPRLYFRFEPDDT